MAYSWVRQEYQSSLLMVQENISTAIKCSLDSSQRLIFPTQTYIGRAGLSILQYVSNLGIGNYFHPKGHFVLQAAGGGDELVQVGSGKAHGVYAASGQSQLPTDQS